MFATRIEGGLYLPVTADSAKLVLSETKVDPDGVVNGEWGYVKVRNPPLRQFLLEISRQTLWGREYREGAMFTHRILRYQAVANGGQLPLLSDDLVMAYFQDVKEDVNENSRPDIRLEDLYREWAVRLSFADWELGGALTELTRYRPNKAFIYGGANDVYSLFRKHLEGKRLEESLGLI